MAPEVEEMGIHNRDNQHYSAAVDIWALGMTWLELRCAWRCVGMAL